MKKMTRLQELLTATKISNAETVRLFDDFPEILNDAQFADSIYEHIRESAGLDVVNMQHSFLVAEREIIAFMFGALEIRLDLPQLLSLWLPMTYRKYIPKEGEYDKGKTLVKAVATVCESLDYLKKYLDKTSSRAVQEAWALVIANKSEFGGLSLQEARGWFEKSYKIKFRAGRKPNDLAP